MCESEAADYVLQLRRTGSHRCEVSQGGKRARRRDVSASLFSSVNAVLPSVQLVVDGVSRNVLVDTECSTSIICVSYCSRWTKSDVSFITVGGNSTKCLGVGHVSLRISEEQFVQVDVLVVEFRPVGFDMILGMNGILSLGGVSVSPGGGVRFGDRLLHCCSMAVAQEDKTGEIVIDEKDFRAVFDERSRSWTVSWKWATGEEPNILKNTISQYKIRAVAKCQYDKEIERWIELGWLIPFDESVLGPAKGLIPMMAVNQKNGRKVRPVMDYRAESVPRCPHCRSRCVCREVARMETSWGKSVTGRHERRVPSIES